MSASRICTFDIACNDGRNGQFAGVALAATWHSHRGGGFAELEPRFFEGVKFDFNERRLVMTFDGVTYPFVQHNYWSGNWCNDRFAMKRPAAMRLLRDMVAKGWTCTAGPTRIFELFKSMEPR